MRFDLHVHSKYSLDSRMEPADIVATARRIGLSGIAVVDHGTVRGGLEAAEHAGDDLIVIPGIEVTTALGHIIGLFLSRDISSLDPARVVEEIHTQGGIAVLAHPLRSSRDLPDDLLNEMDAVEGFNARSTRLWGQVRDAADRQAVDLAREHDLALVAGSDGHFHHEIGLGVTEMEAVTAEEAHRAIIEKRTSTGGRRSCFLYRLMSFCLKKMTSEVPDGGATSAGT